MDARRLFGRARILCEQNRYGYCERIIDYPTF